MSLSDNNFHIIFERVIEQYGDMIYRIALTITGNEEDAKDVFQETLLRLVRYQHRITGEEHLKAWLIRVATNCAKTQVANPWNKNTQGMDVRAEGGSVSYEQEDDGLLTELQRLPAKYSVVLYLYYYEGYSIKEIAQTLKKNENSVKTLLVRSRDLRERFILRIWQGMSTVTMWSLRTE